MPRRSKHNPFTYNLEKLRQSSFEHRSLKRYKSKYPRKRELNRWSPNYDIHLIGMDLLVSRGKLIDSLLEHLGNQLNESELEQLLSGMRSVYNIYVDDKWFFRKPLKPPLQVVVFTSNPRDNIEQFSKLLLDNSRGLTAFISTKENFDLTLKFYIKEMNIPLKLKNVFRDYIEETFYPCFDPLNSPSRLPRIVYGFSPTLSFDEQLTPMMLLHELAEALMAFFDESKGIDLRELVENESKHSLVIPRFFSPTLERLIVPQLIERREVIIEFFTRYLVNGEVRLKDVESNALNIGEDEIRMLVDKMNEVFSRVLDYFVGFNAPLFVRI